MLHELLAASPGCTFQIAQTERAVEHFCLIQPRSMDRSKAGPPPGPMIGEILLGSRSRVTGITVLNQETPLKMSMPATKILQGFGVMVRVFFRQHGSFHLAAMHNQEHQQINRAMSDVLKFLLFDMTGNGSSDRLPF